MLTNEQIRLTLRRGRTTLIVSALVAGAAAGAAAIALPTQHVATVQLLVQPDLQNSGSTATTVVTAETSEARLVSTDMQLITSDAVASAAAHATGIDQADLRSGLSVTSPSNSDLISVSVAGSSAVRSESVLKAVVSAAQELEAMAARSRLELALKTVNQEIAAAPQTSSPGDVGQPSTNSLLQSRSDLTASLAVVGSSIEQFGTVTMSSKPYSLVWFLAIPVGVVIGLLVSSALLLGRTRFKGRIHSPEDVRQLELPLLTHHTGPTRRLALAMAGACRGDDGRGLHTVLVDAGGSAPRLFADVTELLEQSSRKPRLILVGTGAANAVTVPGDENEGSLSQVSLSDDDLFGGGLARMLGALGDADVVVRTSNTDALVYAADAVGRALVVIGVGKPIRSLVQVSETLKERGCEIAGVVVSATEPARARKSSRGSTRS